jgi:hypothetical protein
MAELAGIGQYKSVDPAFVRSAKAEADAMKTLGLTKEYIESRGGVNASGFYGDSWSSSKNLTPEEYDAVIKGALARGLTGAQVGGALNDATAAKESGGTVNVQTGQWSGGTRSTGGGGGGNVPSSPKTMTYTASDGKTFTDAQAYTAYQATLDQQKANRQSAYDLLFQQFDAYGLSGLVSPLKGLIESGINPSEFTIRLRETDAYKKRFGANAQRIQKGLRALSEAEYIGLEDQYQDVMRRYGLPQDYYARGEMGRQEGFEKFIGGDVSPVELEDRIQTAQRRVTNAPKEVKDALTQFYGAEIGNGDILAYVLDPSKAIENIKRKVTAAEIGAGAMQAGLGTSAARAEELQKLGVTGEQARQGYQTIGSLLPRASQLGDIYAKQGMGPFTQTTAEAEVFGTPGAVEAASKRRKLTELEQAQFGGTSGIAQGALSRERAGQF